MRSLAWRCRELRRSATVAEKRLWDRLRNHRLYGLEFRRQHQVGPYILDFYCPRVGLAVEVDGKHHSEPDVAGYDEVRTEYLGARGIRVLRFTNEQVRSAFGTVLESIGQAMSAALNQRIGDLGPGPTETAEEERSGKQRGEQPTIAPSACGGGRGEEMKAGFAEAARSSRDRPLRLRRGKGGGNGGPKPGVAKTR